MTATAQTAIPTSVPQSPAVARPGLLLPSLSLAKRELVRFLRQRHRVIGALATPIVFWLLIGSGMGRSFQAAGAPATASGPGYLQFFFPGTVLMILLFTAIFSTISIIEDRKEGFLQSVLVAPVPRLAIVLGKVLGGATLAFGQGLIFLLLAPLVGLTLTPIGFIAAIGFMAVMSIGLTALGFCIAWRMSSTQGFHAIMNLFLMPMWFLSGALFPPTGVTFRPLSWVMRANPLTYGLAGLRRALSTPEAAAQLGLPGWTVCAVVSVVAAVGVCLLAARIAGTQVKADWQ